MKPIKMTLMMDVETLNFLDKVASLAGTDRDTVMNVILAQKLISLEGDLNDQRKEKTNKRGNGKSPKKSRLASCSRSRSNGSRRS